MNIKLSTSQLLTIIIFKLILILAFLTGYFFTSFTSSYSKNSQAYSLPGASQAFTENSTIPDFSTYTDTKQKKSDFFSFLLPRVIKSNEKILTERAFLTGLNINSVLSKSDNKKMYQLADKYNVKDTESKTVYSELLKRIDIVPPSLVLAQAANESAWGTSRFARKANNLFGQWCYVKGCGIIPLKRGSNEKHEVAKFRSIQGSITSYMLNLNTQFSYEDLRSIRQEMRESNKTITGYKLANGLLKYSTRREAYVHEIQSMIKFNGLSQYDQK